MTKKNNYLTNRNKIWRAAILKFNLGTREHGSWYPGKIIIYDEIKDELLDIINYATMQYIEIERLQAIYRNKKIKKK